MKQMRALGAMIKKNPGKNARQIAEAIHDSP